MMSNKIAGRCLCGTVGFEIEGNPVFSANCHCRDCQRATGSAYMPVIGFPQSAVTVTGEVTYFERRGDSGKGASEGFCPRCGARLFARADVLDGIILVQAGNLDDPSVFKPQFDMYAASAQVWDCMDPALPKYPQMPPLGAGPVNSSQALPVSESHRSDVLEADERTVHVLIVAQFVALRWSSDTTPDFSSLLAGFIEGGRMYPVQRPLLEQTPAAFCARRDALRQSCTLATFEERVLGVRISVFGNLAIALAGCEMTENGNLTTRDVSGFLCLKDAGEWRIAAQAWDLERDGLSLSAALTSPSTGSFL